NSFLSFLVLRCEFEEKRKVFYALYDNYSNKEVYFLENIHELWQYILTEMKDKVSKPSYDTWLSETKASDVTDNVFTVLVPNEFIRNWLEKKYTKIIMQLLFEITGMELDVVFVIEEDNGVKKEVRASSNAPEQVQQQVEQQKQRNMLNSKYTFETFVVVATTRFAHAAALAVAEAPAKSYNPLFIYGGVGLGKTHLMHAIAHYVQEYHPQKNVIYLSSEKFTNEFINAIMENKAELF